MASKPKPNQPLLIRNQPLYLPKGSVRAIIALLLIMPVAFLTLTANINLTGDQVYGLVGIVVTAYFVSKAGAGNDK